MVMEMKGAEKKFQKSYFDVLGLCCSSEVPLIENIVKPLDGVKEVAVIVPSRTVIVIHDPHLISQIQIANALNRARLEANIRVQGATSHLKKWPSPYAMASGLLLLLSMLKYVYHPLEFLALGAVAIGLPPIVLKAIAAVRNLRLDINILMIVAVIGTIAMGDYEEAGTIVFLFTIAEWLESRASHKATAAMSALTNMTPRKAVIAESGETVNAEDVKMNTIIAVKAGEDIPIDGIVVDGDCEVDEKTLTGESFPVPKQKGSSVWAGTTNLNGYVSVKTTVLAEDCVVTKMAKLVEEAQNSKTSTQRFIDKCAKFYTPAVLITSALVAAIPAALRLHNLKFWFHLALVVLVSACPCALILSTPVATFCAFTKAATSGLLIKGGDSLETLAKIKTTAFDKTGTITRGEFVVTDFKSLSSEIDLRTLLHWVSSVESKSSHPMAAAVIDYGRSLSIDPNPEMVKEFQNFPGEGIYGKFDGRDVYIGNRRIAQRAGSETVPVLNCDTKEGKTIGYVYSGLTPAGIFTLSDVCRSGAKEAVQQLKSMGIKTAMLTGDSHAAAMHAQEQLGNAIELVHAELLPEDKVKIIKEFIREGPTAMIGDGVNDAPALATADIGISMGVSGSALASETGNMILMSNDMRKIPKSIKLARKAHRKVIENVILSITTKAAILGLAIAGHPLVWAAVLADVGTCVAVILNSMLLLHTRHRHEGKCCKSSMASNTPIIDCGTCGQNNDDRHIHQNCCSAKTALTTSPNNCSSKHCGSKCHSGSSTSSGNNHEGCGATGHTNHGHHIQQRCCSAKTTERTFQSNCSSQNWKSMCESRNSNSSLFEISHKIACGVTGQINHDHHNTQHCHAAKTSQQHPRSTCSFGNCTTNCQSRSSNLSSTAQTDCSHSVQNCGKCDDNDELCKPKHSHHGMCEQGIHESHSHHNDSNCESHHIKNSRCEDTCNNVLLQELDKGKMCHDQFCLKSTQDREAHCCSSKVVDHSTSAASPSLNKSRCHSNFHGCEHRQENLETHQSPGKLGAGRASTNILLSSEQRKSDSSMHDCCFSVEETGQGSSCCHDFSLKECTENAVLHACMTLDKREVRACCKTYMKECCRNHGQLGAVLGGGLSEIIVEQV